MKTTLDAPGSAIQLQQSVLRGISRSFGDPNRARREVANVRDHYQEHLGPSYEWMAGVVVCMGDTLTHLGSQREVSELLDHVASTHASGGPFITTFRNYVGQPLEGDQRFIAVRADDDRILTCYLECLEDHVRVHDIVHVRAGH